MINRNKLAVMRARAESFKQTYDGGTPLGVDVMRYIDRLTLAAREIVADMNELLDYTEQEESPLPVPNDDEYAKIEERAREASRATNRIKSSFEQIMYIARRDIPFLLAQVRYYEASATPPADAGRPEPRKVPEPGSDEEGLIAAIGYAPVKLSIRDHPEITYEFRTIDDRDGLIERILAAGFTRPEFVNTVEEIDALPLGSVLIGEHRAWRKAREANADQDYPYEATDGTGLYQAGSLTLYETFPLQVIRP